MFTIIIPTHDRPYFLRRALQSLACQTFRDFSVIIVSDSAQYVAPYEELMWLPGPYIYVLRKGIPGPAESRNIAIDLVTTDYALFLDDDDSLEADHLQSLANAVAGSKPDILYCDFKIVEEDRQTIPPQRLSERVHAIAGVTRDSVFVSNVIPNSCLTYSRRVLKAARFDPALTLFEDWDYLLGCLKDSDLSYLPVNSVVIHKSYLAGAANRRRGNVNDDCLVSTTLDIYRKHAAPNELIALLRRKRFESLGLLDSIT